MLGGGVMFNVLDVLSLGGQGLSEIDRVHMAAYKVHGLEIDRNFSRQTFQDSLLEKDASL